MTYVKEAEQSNKASGETRSRNAALSHSLVRQNMGQAVVAWFTEAFLHVLRSQSQMRSRAVQGAE